MDRYLPIVLLVPVILFSCYFLVQFCAPKYHGSRVVMGGKVFSVEIADTDTARERGLSRRWEMPSNHGMLFVFNSPDRYGFWMRETKIPLDIVWLSSDMQIVHMEPDLATSTYPTVYYPSYPAKYVLEVNAGQVDTLGVKIGNRVSYTQN